jgi:hypothetical protein
MRRVTNLPAQWVPGLIACLLASMITSVTAAGEWTQVDPPTSPPPRKNENALAYDESRGRLVLFGGNGAGSSRLGDTWGNKEGD